VKKHHLFSLFSPKHQLPWKLCNNQWWLSVVFFVLWAESLPARFWGAWVVHRSCTTQGRFCWTTNQCTESQGKLCHKFLLCLSCNASFYPSVSHLFFSRHLVKLSTFILFRYFLFCIYAELRRTDLNLWIWQPVHNVVLSCQDGLWKASKPFDQCIFGLDSLYKIQHQMNLSALS
jgi:hypothetical protein